MFPKYLLDIVVKIPFIVMGKIVEHSRALVRGIHVVFERRNEVEFLDELIELEQVEQLLEAAATHRVGQVSAGLLEVDEVEAVDIGLGEGAVGWDVQFVNDPVMFGSYFERDDGRGDSFDVDPDGEQPSVGFGDQVEDNVTMPVGQLKQIHPCEPLSPEGVLSAIDLELDFGIRVHSPVLLP
jgi:hypothetical protein